MANRYSTDPFDDRPQESLTFTDITLLSFLFVAVSALTVLIVLGTVCADHRIAATLARLL